LFFFVFQIFSLILFFFQCSEDSLSEEEICARQVVEFNFIQKNSNSPFERKHLKLQLEINFLQIIISKFIIVLPCTFPKTSKSNRINFAVPAIGHLKLEFLKIVGSSLAKKTAECFL